MWQGGGQKTLASCQPARCHFTRSMKLISVPLVIITNALTLLMCYLYHYHADKDLSVRVSNPGNVEVFSGVHTTLPKVVVHHNSVSSLVSNHSIISNQLITCTHSPPNSNSNSSTNASHLPTIIAITPTYKRLTQKVDLVSLCNTVMNVPSLLWIVVEDATSKSNLVANVLGRCRVSSVHLNAVTSKETKRASQRGVEQRNSGLDWARKHCREHCASNCSGVVYFMDDDNKYDLRLFDELRKTEMVSVFPVAFSGGLQFEGPICKDGKAEAWQAVWQSKERHVPVDMAAFAIHINLFIQKPEVRVGFRPGQKNKRSKKGFMESDLIKSIGSSREQIECRGVPNEVLVWHVKTTKPFLSYKSKYPHVEV